MLTLANLMSEAYWLTYNVSPKIDKNSVDALLLSLDMLDLINFTR